MGLGVGAGAIGPGVGSGAIGYGSGSGATGWGAGSGAIGLGVVSGAIGLASGAISSGTLDLASTIMQTLLMAHSMAPTASFAVRLQQPHAV